VSVWYATPAVTTEQRQISSAFLGAVGTQLPVIEEKYLDMATALSGSGPAYVFLFLEALIDAGVQIGFARPVAEQLATQTLAGAVAYAQQSNQHPAVLRNQVTSPAGTTAAGLLALEQGAFRAVVQNCVQAAYQRALELGK
jgi:pyrroline-5-carboxylate reductase